MSNSQTLEVTMSIQNNTLRPFPPEIRIIIFKLAMESEKNDDENVKLDSDLLIALRPDQTLYIEAIEVYNQINYFPISLKN